METITAEQAETEAARNWCAGLLAGAGSRIEGDVAKRWVAIGVGTLLGVYKDEEMSDEEKAIRCDEVYAEGDDSVYPRICTVDGEHFRFCEECPLRPGRT